MKLKLLLGKRALDGANPKDYTGWAESLLYGNIESENAAILASMGYERDPDLEEIEVYFQRTLKDLGLNLPAKEEALKIYSKCICEQILTGDLEPNKGVSILELVYSKSHREAVYVIWKDLGQDIKNINEGGCSIFNSGLTFENNNKYIQSVADQFIALLNIRPSICSCFFCFSICTECGFVGESELESIERPSIPAKLYNLIHKRDKTPRPICSNCRMPFPKSMRTYEGRKYFLSKNS